MAVLGALLAVVLGAAASGAGASVMFAEVRHGVLDSVFDDRSGLLDRAPWIVPAALTAGFVGVVGGAAAYRAAARRLRGGEDPWTLAGPLGLAAFTGGFVALRGEWLSPLEVGTRVDPTFGEDEPWEWYHWLLHRAEVWLPLALVVLTVLVALGAARANAWRTGTRRERDRLLREGHRSVGLVTDARQLVTRSNEGAHVRFAGTEVTVRYPDPFGVDRYVERLCSDNRPLRVERRVQVLSDPARPSDESRIFVSFETDPGPTDWIGPPVSLRRRRR